jgi:hypothetical protein
MYILTPKQSDIFPKLPVYMLFGDTHDSDQNLCDRKSSPDAVNIYDVNFLSILNKLILRPDDETIDFYVEGGELHVGQYLYRYIEPHPLKQTWNLFKECYRNKKNPTRRYNEKKCKDIKNIR